MHPDATRDPGDQPVRESAMLGSGGAHSRLGTHVRRRLAQMGLVVAFLVAVLCVAPAGAAPLPGEVDDRLAAALKKHADAENRIAITFTNKGYLDFVGNWLYYVRELGVENYLILALDSEAYDALTALSANVVLADVHAQQGGVDRSATDFGSEPFKKIVHLKPTLTLRVLELGYSLLLRQVPQPAGCLSDLLSYFRVQFPEACPRERAVPVSHFHTRKTGTWSKSPAQPI